MSTQLSYSMDRVLRDLVERGVWCSSYTLGAGLGTMMALE